MHIQDFVNLSPSLMSIVGALHSQTLLSVLTNCI